MIGFVRAGPAAVAILNSGAVPRSRCLKLYGVRSSPLHHSPLRAHLAMSNVESELIKPGAEVEQFCLPEHCFHSFDALFCALTSSKPISAKFPDGQ